MKLQKVFLIVVLLVSQVINAEVYKYHPESWLRLGGGLNPYYPSTGYAQCIEHEGEERVDSSGVRDTTATLAMIKTRADFYSLTNFSASIAGSYKFYSGSASYRSEEEQMFHSDSLTWIVFFESNYGIFGLKNAKLKKEYRSLNTDDLYATCGSEIVIEQKKKAMAYAIFSLSNVSESFRREVEAKLNAKANSGAWSASMEASFKSVLRTASAASNLTVKVRAIGGAGISNLADLVGPKTSEEDGYEYYSRVPAALKRYVEGLSTETAAPSDFMTASIQVFRAGLPMRYQRFKSGQIGLMYTAYEDAESVAQRAGRILRGTDGKDYNLTDDQRVELERAQSQATAVMNQISAAVRPCFEVDKTCQVPEIKNVYVVWPTPQQKKKSTCEIMQTMAVEAGCITQEMAASAAANKSMPICTSYDAGVGAKLGGWKTCSPDQLKEDISWP